jgi:hypothetical protein
MGYTPDEIDDIQARWRLRFPPDLVTLLREHRPLLGGPGAFDWISSDVAKIRSLLEWPLESFWFDVEHSEVWWDDWGEKPVEAGAQREVLNAVFAAAPRLIPLFGHRYIAEEPCEHDNPVFSVYQTDVIHYGANLTDWLRREHEGFEAAPWPTIKNSRFWTEAVRRNNAPP